MEPSTKEKLQLIMWDCLENWHRRENPRTLDTEWEVGCLTTWRKVESNGKKQRVITAMGVLKAKTETCGRPGQKRIVMTWAKREVNSDTLKESAPVDTLYWSARIAFDGAVWSVITPNTSGWTKVNRFTSIQQLAEQRLAHFNTGIRQNGIMAGRPKPPMEHEQPKSKLKEQVFKQLELIAMMSLLPLLILLTNL